ncbi:MAG: cytochrome c biogenesis protein ResB [Planctomycetota bacterium]|nr:cytochrome c biogenesis protein ResB [Planctomycetota bacterium]
MSKLQIREDVGINWVHLGVGLVSALLVCGILIMLFLKG